MPGVRGEIIESMREGDYVAMRIEWDPELIGLTSGDVGKLLSDGKPRIKAHTGGEGHSMRIRAAALYPGDEKFVADRLHEIFGSAPGRKGPRPAPEPPAADVNGHWDVEIEYVVGQARHQFFLAMDGARVRGVHQGRIAEGRVRGTVAGDRVDLRTSTRFEGTSLGYSFTGRVHGDAISGDVDLGGGMELGAGVLGGWANRPSRRLVFGGSGQPTI